MAGLEATAVATSGNSTGTSAKTILQIIAPANQGVRVKRLSVSFEGVSPTAGKIKVEVLKGATGGTATNLTVQKKHGHGGSVQTTAKENFTAEPGGSPVILFTESVHPQGGYTAPEEFLIVNETLGIRVTAPAGVNYNARIVFEE